jgi:hypothetical protein
VAASIWASAAVALEADDLGVVHQPVDPGRRVGPGFDQALERVLATTGRAGAKEDEIGWRDWAWRRPDRCRQLCSEVPLCPTGA